MKEVRHPHVQVKLVGEDGNAFFILGRGSGEMKRVRISEAEQKAFMDEAQSSDYNNLLRTVEQWVTADPDPDDFWNRFERIDCEICTEGNE